MIHYSCIGATGYVCGEVLRMMVNHPDGELVNVLDTYGVGDAISTHHPALRGFYDQTILDSEDIFLIISASPRHFTEINIDHIMPASLFFIVLIP